VAECRAQVRRALALPSGHLLGPGVDRLDYTKGTFERFLHDGMNLVAKEFVAAREDEQGVLVLSQFTDAARELHESLIGLPARAALWSERYMRRYEAPDDFGKPETAFNICTFWRIDALARIGRMDEACAVFEAMLARRNHLGLLSEDTHPQTGEMWGNFPQTYSMVRLSAPCSRVV